MTLFRWRYQMFPSIVPRMDESRQSGFYPVILQHNTSVEI